ncbi:MAG: homoserine dehydrogenase, partial [Thermodesulfobacteriota bacterium]
MKQVNIGIVGLGTVGTGIVKMLTDNADVIRARLGAELVLKKAADIDIKRERGVAFDQAILTTDPYEVVNDPDIAIVCEMIGGKGIARQVIEAAIDNGKHVVTANKALLAEHGNEIFARAAEKGVSVAFEASTGGCMPIVKTLRETLVGNRIQALTGILNGTCNYILTRITDEGMAFEDALEDAQREGYAEADPSLDVDGYDTAHKLAILSALAYGMKINLDDIYMEGISKITPMDIEFALECGYKIKLLAISKFDGQAVEARIHPTMTPFDDQLSNVDGSLNAVTVSGDAVGDMVLFGHGAGMMPTASAVISDTVDIARSIIAGGAMRVPMLSCQMDHVREMPIRPIDEIETHYYFRFSAIDRPGVLSKIAGILGEHDISIKFVHQIERKLNGGVPVFMLTHLAKENQVKQALDKIASLDVIT